jgi:predicted RNA binding protein YcfA (HicA-like mRNA interferase family)
MGSIPVLEAREVIARLRVRGFIEVRQRGSHKQFRHADGRRVTVAVHARDIPPGLLKQICREICVTVKDFIGD